MFESLLFLVYTVYSLQKQYFSFICLLDKCGIYFHRNKLISSLLSGNYTCMRDLCYKYLLTSTVKLKREKTQGKLPSENSQKRGFPEFDTLFVTGWRNKGALSDGLHQSHDKPWRVPVKWSQSEAEIQRGFPRTEGFSPKNNNGVDFFGSLFTRFVHVIPRMGQSGRIRREPSERLKHSLVVLHSDKR